MLRQSSVVEPLDDAEFWNPKKRGPTCMNAPAARSAMPVTNKVTELALAGQSKDAILAHMKESIAKKESARRRSDRCRT